MKAVLPGAQVTTGIDLLIAQISIFHDGISVVYLVPSNEAAKEVLETAFGETATYDGVSFRLEPGISRRKVLVPAVTAVLESYPHE